MKAFIKVLTLLIILTVAGCKSKGGLDSKGMPDKLVIGVIQTEGIEQIKQIREKMRTYLEKKLGMPVELIYTSDYTGLIEALRANKIQMADMPPFAYVLASRKMKLTPLVTLGHNGKPNMYKSVIIVNSQSKIKTIADLKANAKNLTFCFVEPASTSGHLVPRAYLNAIGLDPNKAFKETVFAGTHLSAVLSVKSGKIDVGCTTDLVFGIMANAKMIKESDLRVLWTSDPIVSDPVVVKSELNKDLAKKIKDAYLSIAKDEPSILGGYTKIIFRDTIHRAYIPVSDTSYNGLRKIAGGLDELKAN